MTVYRSGGAQTAGMVLYPASLRAGQLSFTNCLWSFPQAWGTTQLWQSVDATVLQQTKMYGQDSWEKSQMCLSVSSDDSHSTPTWHGRNYYKSKATLFYKIPRRPWFHTLLPPDAPKSKPHIVFLILKSPLPQAQSRCLSELRNEERSREIIAQCPNEPAVACQIKRSPLC